MSGGVTPVLRNVVDRLTRNLTRTLDLGTRSVARTYERTSGTTRTALRTVDNADTSIGHHLLEETRTVSQPNPMRMPARNWNYRRSDTESTMAARRLSTNVEFTDDMRDAVARSSTEVRKMRSEDGELNIYKPIHGEKYDANLPFIHAPGALTSREIAAYRVDEILGFGRIPPTARTDGVVGPDGRHSGPGMIQQFVDSTPSRSIDAYPRVQQQQVGVLDYLIGALDRHPGNYRTVDRGTHLDLVAIDHGRSFPLARNPHNIAIDSDFVAAHKGQQLEPEVLDAIRNADTGRLRAAMGDAGLHPNAIDGALARLERVRELGHIPANVWILPP
ncbi:phosphatidylinositol 4-kinase [Nocardia sp. NBC_01503]|uniref:hypothetical protein n=1 Tax=Nocardia sp. NBC_01503 TaxID=2975997 RepID=UPI002E7BFB26|nr:hypothetical protein [Nocardia sp. NBC_01503]WTL29939.1 phosphatidylinositol 4-kinase [Nocardia sp. NBC_01503]